MHTIDPEQTLQTPRLLLEPLVPAHATALYASLRDPRLYTFIPQESPPSLQSLEARYRHLATRHSPDGQEIWLNWVLQRRGTRAYVGLTEASIYADRTATLAYLIFVPFWGRGYAKEGCARVLTHLFDDYKVTSVAAEIDARNDASLHLVESLGFVRVATIPHADFFKGAPSDEYRYERSASWTRERFGAAHE